MEGCFLFSFLYFGWFLIIVYFKKFYWSKFGCFFRILRVLRVLNYWNLELNIVYEQKYLIFKKIWQFIFVWLNFFSCYNLLKEWRIFRMIPERLGIFLTVLGNLCFRVLKSMIIKNSDMASRNSCYFWNLKEIFFRNSVKLSEKFFLSSELIQVSFSLEFFGNYLFLCSSNLRGKPTEVQ